MHATTAFACGLNRMPAFSTLRGKTKFKKI
jgi:hypothetical protein